MHHACIISVMHQYFCAKQSLEVTSGGPHHTCSPNSTRAHAGQNCHKNHHVDISYVSIRQHTSAYVSILSAKLPDRRGGQNHLRERSSETDELSRR
jgi:hypothetical protein